MLVFSASTVSWTCLCSCPTKWLSPCMRQVVCPCIPSLCLSPVSTIFNSSRESKPAVLVFPASTVSSWTCLCSCPTKWLSPCMRQVVCPTPLLFVSVSCLYNLQFIWRVQTCACIFSKHCFFVDLFVCMSN